MMKKRKKSLSVGFSTALEIYETPFARSCLTMSDNVVVTIVPGEAYKNLKPQNLAYPLLGFKPNEAAGDRGNGWPINAKGEVDPSVTGPVFVFANQLRGPVDLRVSAGGDVRTQPSTEREATPARVVPPVDSAPVAPDEEPAPAVDGDVSRVIG